MNHTPAPPRLDRRDFVKTLSAAYDAWAHRAGARPWPLNAAAAGKAGKKKSE